MKSAKAGWRRRRRRVKKTDNTPEFDGQIVPVRKRGRPKAQAGHKDSTMERPDSKNGGESTDHINEDLGREINTRLMATDVSGTTSGLG